MSGKVTATFGSLVFLVLAPGMVAGFLPWSLSRWRMCPAWFGIEALRWIGVAFIVIGVAFILDTFARFAWQGLGTPAPILPARRLVVSGPYRYVRNPMYCAVVAMVLGQGLLLANLTLVGYGAIVWLFSHVFVTVYEEPVLVRTFGSAYRGYRRAVPRWIPRLILRPR